MKLLQSQHFSKSPNCLQKNKNNKKTKIHFNKKYLKNPQFFLNKSYLLSLLALNPIKTNLKVRVFCAHLF